MSETHEYYQGLIYECIESAKLRLDAAISDSRVALEQVTLMERLFVKYMSEQAEGNVR